MWFAPVAKAIMSRESGEGEVGFWSALQAVLAQVPANTLPSRSGLGAQKGRRTENAGRRCRSWSPPGFACCGFLVCFVIPANLCQAGHPHRPCSSNSPWRALGTTEEWLSSDNVSPAVPRQGFSTTALWTGWNFRQDTALCLRTEMINGILPSFFITWRYREIPPSPSQCSCHYTDHWLTQTTSFSQGTHRKINHVSSYSTKQRAKPVMG